MIRLYNSLSHKKEDFIPIDPKNVRMYVCGPTVYSRAHIGNARSVVIFDMLYRILKQEYGKDSVTYVRNITDVDDKINAEAKKLNISINQVTEKTINLFNNDMSSLGCLKPNKEPKATEHIPDMIFMISRLIENNFAYEAQNHVLFSVKSNANYGHLSRRSHDEMIAGARVEVAPYKKDPGDFILWKPSSSDEPGWDSPWGIGRPGWHIECSAMSTKYLGNTFDIHGGGADLQFPHHENEIAQSCCANKDSEYAKFWIHNGFLTVESQKMSKSLGNFITMGDLLEKENIQGELIRFVLLSTHYKKPLNWTEKLLSDSKKSLDYFYEIFLLYKKLGEKDLDCIEIPQGFLDALKDDMNTSLAISFLYNLAKDIESSSEIEKEKLLLSFVKAAQFLGLLLCENYFESSNKEIKDIFSDLEIKEVESMIKERNEARNSKNWKLSDIIRDKLKEKNIEIQDNPNGTTSWFVK